jgi:hypothetical protein
MYYSIVDPDLFRSFLASPGLELGSLDLSDATRFSTENLFTPARAIPRRVAPNNRESVPPAARRGVLLRPFRE